MTNFDFGLVMAWATDHWWLAFWVVFWALVFAYGISIGVMVTMRRLLRFVVVVARGWPPAHLDADGDWRSGSGEPEKPDDLVATLKACRAYIAIQELTAESGRLVREIDKHLPRASS